MKTMLGALARNFFCGWILLACAVSHNALAQTPSNDTCAGAIPLANGVPYVMGTTNATSTGDPADCLDPNGKGVWFTYTPGADGLVVVDTCGSSFTTALGVYTNSCGSLVRLLCGDFDNGFCAGRYVASFVGKAGVSYHILAGGYYDLGSGTLQITASSKRVSNDDCAGAIPLTNGVAYVMSTASATSPGDPGDCVAGLGKAVWFTYTPAADGLVVVDTCGSSFTTALGVYTNGCGSPVRLKCGDFDNGFCASRQVVSFVGKAATTYHILAGGYSDLLNGTLQITANGPCGPLRFTSLVPLSGTNLVLSGTCGWPGSNYVVLASTNVALPLSSWTRLRTNTFDSSGNFSFTYAITPSFPRRFFAIQVP